MAVSARGVEVDDVELPVHVISSNTPKKAEARGVDKHGDLRLLTLQQRLYIRRSSPASLRSSAIGRTLCAASALKLRGVLPAAR